ncbi:enoyl-CoA hydratase [Rhodococcus globerulus]|uniref:enoyl-CoA hydratase n=1 Tax=Rhodococcus globerulus TaxID=33008 RepID=UPI000A5D79D2|nr:enoyl-CoA hydratase [Rhodococcus globerulus]
MTATRPDVYSTHDNGVLRVVINRPHRMNAVNTEALQNLSTIFDDHARRGDVRVAVLEGAGRAFCTGADLADAVLSGPPSADTIDAANDLARAIRSFPTPVIAAVRGPAAGVGVSLALACDLTLAAESSYFLLAFTKVGLMPDGGATALVAASIGRARAMRMALLAEKLSARDAFDSGLVSQVCPDDAFDDELAELIRRLGSGPGKAFQQTKDAINDATLTELDSAFERERAGQISLLAGADFAEGVAAFQGKRAAVFGG